jgi:molybdopterin converting factor small subunit
MSTMRIPALLRSYTAGQAEIPISGGSVAEAMQHLVEQFPALQPHLYTPAGEMRLFVNLFLNGENIQNLQGLDTPLNSEDVLRLVPSIAGG